MDQNSRLWCGIDLAKKSFEASLVTDQHVTDMRKIPVKGFEHNRRGIAAFLKWLDRHCKKLNLEWNQVHLVCEATGSYSLKFFKEISSQREEPWISIVNPAYTSSFQKSLGFRNKTDVLDARVLGMFARERKPERYHPRSPKRDEIREFYRQRETLIQEKTAHKARYQELASEGARLIEEQLVDFLTELIKEVEEKIRELIDKDEELREHLKLLQSIPGVGFVTGVAILSELDDLREYKRAGSLASFVGLAPQHRESGTSVKSKPRISKGGNSRVRKSLYMAALAWTHKPKEGLGVFYKRLVERGKEKKSALLAVARKMLVMMRAILISGKPYEDRYGEAKLEKKVKPGKTPLEMGI